MFTFAVVVIMKEKPISERILLMSTCTPLKGCVKKHSGIRVTNDQVSGNIDDMMGYGNNVICLFLTVFVAA